MLLDEDEKASPIPMGDLINKRPAGAPRKRPLWENLIQPIPARPVEEDPSGKPKPQEKTMQAEPPEVRVQKGFNEGQERVQNSQRKGSIGVEKGFNKGLVGVQSKGSEGVQTDITKSVAQLRGNNFKYLTHIFELCRANCETVTPPISLKKLSEEISMPWESIRTCIKRLCSNALLERVGNTKGPNAIVQYRLPEDVYRSLNMRLRKLGLSEVGVQNVGSEGVQSSLCSSSNLKTTTTNGFNTDEEIDPSILERVNELNLKTWGITKAHLLRFVGPNKICETFEDLEEFLHRVEFVIADIEKKGKRVNSKAGFLISRLKGEPLGLPEGYVSLKEKRIRADKEEKERELERIRAAKEEKYRVEYALFREKFDPVEKEKLLNEIRTEEGKNHPDFASKETLDRTVQARFSQMMVKLFLEQFIVEDERNTVMNLLL